MLAKLQRSDITIRVNEDLFGLRWHRLLFPFEGLPAIHLGPVTFGNPVPASEGHSEPTLPAPVDATTPLPDDQDPVAPGAVQGPAADLPPPADGIDDAANPFGGPAALYWHPPYLAPEPLVDSPGNLAQVPDDAAPPGGFIPKAEALIWSGPAIMAVPSEWHDNGSNAGAADTHDAGTGGATTDVHDTGGDTAVSDPADAPAAVSRGDLDPELSPMSAGTEHGASDLGAAFLPPDADEPPHGLDSGFLLTTLPLPPPPEVI